MLKDVMKIVGDKGKYQYIIIIIVFGFSILTDIYILQLPFILEEPMLNVKFKNSTDNYTLVEYSLFYCNSELFEIEKNTENSIHNLAYQYNIYCENFYIKYLIKIALYVGLFISYLIFNSFPDKHGRERLFQYITIASLFIQINLLINFGSIHTIIIYLFGGFLSFFHSMCYYITIEFISQDWAGFVLGLTNSVFPIFGLLLCLYYYLINNWRILYIILIAINIILIFITLKYLVETPSWLSSVGRRDELIENLNFIAEINNNIIQWKQYQQENKEKMSELCSNEDDIMMNSKNFSIKNIFKIKSQRKKLIKMIILWLCIGTFYYTIILNLENFEGNFFLNCTLAFIGELIGGFLSGYLSKIFGRVLLLKILSITSFIGYIVYLFVPTNIRAYFVIFYTFNFSSLFNILSIYTPEIFPSQIRSSCCGFLYFIGRMSPLLNIIIVFVLLIVFYYFFLLFEFIITIVLCFTLEETLNNSSKNELSEEELMILYGENDFKKYSIYRRNSLEDSVMFFGFR